MRGLKRLGASRRADGEGSVGFDEKDAGAATRDGEKGGGLEDSGNFDEEDLEDDDADDLDLSEWDVSRLNKRQSDVR